MSFSFAAKTIASFTQSVKHFVANYFLLKEDGFYLLLETGDKIILEDSGGAYTNSTKHIS